MRSSKKVIISLLLALTMLFELFPMAGGAADAGNSVLSGSGTEDSPYLIRSADDWNALSNYINNGGTDYTGAFFELTDDIAVSTMLGTRPGNRDDEDIPFTGTFDGGGHTITCNINTSGFAAPFAVAYNSTIKNLNVAGVIRTSGNHAAGVVSAPKGVVGTENCDITIKNVKVTAKISCNSHVAGIIGHAHSANITMDNVVFDGSIDASSIQGGFIGWGGSKYNTGYTVSLKNCLFAGTYNANASFNPVAFASGQGTVKLINDFYTTSLGNGGSPITPTGAGQVKLMAAAIEKGGAANYFDSFATAANSSNWTEGSTLKLWTDSTTSSTITVPSGEHSLDLNGRVIKMTSSGSVISLGSGADLTVNDTSGKVGKITGGSAGLDFGGGITVDGGKLTLKGGAVSGNSNTYNNIGNCGGGVFVKNGGEFYMEGGEISGNTSYIGGAVCADTSGTTVVITGGVIKNNTTERFGSAILAGRSDSSVFRIGGDVQIINNISKWTSDKDGEGTINFSSSLLLSGNPTIHGDWKTSGTSSRNTHINLDNKGTGLQLIELDGELTNDTGTPSITVTPLYRWSDLSSGKTFVFTKNWSTYMGTATPADYFKLDDSVAGIKVIRKDGEAAITGGSDLGDLYITFDANGGEGEMEAQFVTGTSAVLKQNTLSYDGKVFNGWNTEQNGSGTPYSDVASVTLSGDLKLYAQWTDLAASIIIGDSVTNYLSFSDALSAWTAGSTLRLTSDITTGSTITVPSGERTLDLNGHEIKRTGASGNDNSGLVITMGSGANLTVTGPGKITGGKGFHGGGIHVEGSSSLVLDNCEISGNTGHYGGGLYLKNGTITLKNGTEVKNNSATEGFGGSGIYAEGGGTLILEGGTFTNNEIRNSNQYAVFLAGNANAQVSGTPVIYNNKYGSVQKNLYMFQSDNQNSIVRIAGELTSGAKVGVGQTTGAGRITSGWKDNMGNDDPSKYFISDSDSYGVFLNNGEAEIGVPPAASIVIGETMINYNSVSDALSAWTAGSTLRLTSDITTGSTITVPSGDHTLDLNGYGIKMTGSGSVITVGNNATLNVEDSNPDAEHRFTVSNAKSNGAGLATVNDALSANYLTFTGGYITGGSSRNGGGIKVNGTAYLVLNAGTVIGNRSSFMGAGIKADNNGDNANVNVTVNGGAVIYNTVNGYGAGICSDGAVRINGGTIAYNVASNNPGGIHSHYLHLNGGRIENNFAGAADFACGAHADHEVYISGNPVVYDNLINGTPVNLDWDRTEYNHGHKINIVGELTEGAKIGVTIRAGTPGMFTSGWKDAMGNTAPSGYFFSDNGDYIVVMKDDEAFLRYPDLTNVIANDYTGDYDGKSHSITVNIPDGASIMYGTEEGSYTLSEKPGFTDAGNYTVFYKVSKDKYTPVTGSATVTINQISATVTITGHNDEFDYNGEAHTVSGYDAAANTALYDVTSSFTFSGDATAESTNAGTVKMGLAASQFENTNPNFKTVTFEITDGYVKVNPIDAVVTITGHNGEFDYDGEAHTTSGYDAEADTDLYDVTSSFTFSGDATAESTNAGTVNMGLAADQFENTNPNFKTVTFNVTDGYIKIDPIDAVVTITGHKEVFDYDGKSHTANGYDAEADTPLYDVASSFTFSGSGKAEAKDAGIVMMGLAADQFENTNSNFKTVTFNVTDGYIKIEPIDVLVRIVGNTRIADYDETIQTVTGYTASSDNKLYDVKHDFTFKGVAEAKRAFAGTAEMGLDASQFTNINKNFAKVVFSVTDGYITVLPVDAELTAAPEALEVTYDGNEHELVAPGLANGGMLRYALGENGEIEPGAWEFAQAIPTATECGIYYVWYMVVGDNNHKDLDAECVKVCIVNDEWGSLSGILYQSDGKTPVTGAVVTLTKGNQTIDTVVTGADGKYTFTVPDGVYNIVAEFDNKTQTILTTVSGETEQDIDIPDGNTESILKVNSEDASALDVSVGGLEKEARDIRKADKIPDATSVSVTMTVEAKADKTAENSETFFALVSNKIFEFFDIKVEKTVDAVTTVLDETTNVLEIAISYPKIDRRDLAVYSYHGDEIREFTESDSKTDGTFRIDKENSMIFIYSSKFSTYAIGYTPYYKVSSTASLGSYDGKVNVTLENTSDGTLYKLEGVGMDAISFKDIPMGEYTMTVTWEDGAENSLTLPLSIKADEKAATADDGETASTLALDRADSFTAVESTLSTDAKVAREVKATSASAAQHLPVAAESIMIADEPDRAKYARMAFAPAAYDFSKSRQKDRFQI